jgi:hypothetical protein
MDLFDLLNQFVGGILAAVSEFLAALFALLGLQ